MNKCMLNILVVHHFAGLGGAERSLLQALRYLSEQEDVRVHLLSPEGDLSSQLPEGVHFHRMAFRPPSRNPFKALLSVFLLLGNAISTLRYCRRHHVNRLYVGSIRSLLVALPSRILLQMPLVYHLRDSLRGWLLPRLLWMFASRVISVSEFIQRQLVRHLPTVKCRVIYNGIPGSDAGETSRDDVKTIGFAGQLVAWKRVELLIEAFRLLRQRQEKIQLVIAGQAHFPQDSTYEKNLRAMCAGEDSISFTGWRADIGQFFREIDILMLPSRDEPFGRVLVEAMLADVAVVGVGSGAIPEIIEDGESGLLCGQTPEEIAAAMERMICDRELRHWCIKNARTVAEQRFSAERYGREVNESLRDAL